MLSLRELERAAAILRREIVGHRIQQVAQPDATSVVLELYGAGEDENRRRWLTFSCDPERARVGAPSEAPGAGALRFAQYLRAHLRGARVRDVELLDGERQLALRAVGAEGELTLLLAISRATFSSLRSSDFASLRNAPTTRRRSSSSPLARPRSA